MKIGVFDSGLGGLTVVKSILDIIKGADIFYVADTKNAPYGEKSSQEILDYSLNISNYLVTVHKVDAIILACNTATSFAVEELRTLYPNLIIIGTEPGIKPAMEASINLKIGVLATLATLSGEKYKELTKSLSQTYSVDIESQSCQGLVELIEDGNSDDEIEVLLKSWLSNMISRKVDTIVLGCTHYPLIAQNIKNIVPYDINIIETGDAIAKHLLYKSKSINHTNTGDINLTIYVTGDINKAMISTILNSKKTLKIIKTNI